MYQQHQLEAQTQVPASGMAWITEHPWIAAPNRIWAGVWNAVTQPSACISELGQRRQARFLSALLLLLVWLVLLAGLVPQMILLGDGPGHVRIEHAMLASEAVLIALYGLSRTRYVKLAAVLTVSLTSASMFAISASSGGSGEVDLLIYLIVPVLLSSMLLDTKLTFLLLMGQTTGLMLSKTAPGPAPVVEPSLVLILITSALVLAASLQQQLIDRDRKVELVTSEGRYRAVSELSTDFAYALRIDTNGTFSCEWITDAFTHISGYKIAELSSSDLWERLIHPDDLALFKQHMQQRLAGHSNSVEFRILTRSGDVRWLSDRGKPEWDSSKKHVVQIYGAAHDITERKRTNEAVARYIRRLNLLHAIDQSVLAHLAPADVAHVVLEGLQTLVPVDGTSVILFDREENNAHLLGSAGVEQHVYEVGEEFPFDALAPFMNLDLPEQTFIDDLATLSVDSPYLRKLQSNGVHSYVCTPLITEQELIGILSFSAREPAVFSDDHGDIAWELSNQLAIAIHYAELRGQIQAQNTLLSLRVEQRTAELQRVTERVESIFNNSADAVILAYVDGTIVQTNDAFDRMFGYAADELFHDSLLVIAAQEDADVLSAVLPQVTAEHAVRHLEVTVCRKNRSTFSAEIGIALLEQNTPHRDMIVCNVHDVTQRKAAEAELLKMLEKERHLSELQTRFVSMASHELRTPLTTIMSSIDLVEHYSDRLDTARQREHFERVRNATRYMTELIESVLIYGRTESNRLRSVPVPLDLEDLCQTIVNDLTPHTHKLPLTIELSCTGTCQDVVLDRMLARYIVSNLVSNAVKYTPQGGTVRLDVDSGNQGTHIVVSDQGLGIPDDFREHLFEPFTRASNVQTIRGTGLGLTITGQAVSLMNGTITVSSKVGSGTTFRVFLPIQEVGQD